MEKLSRTAPIRRSAREGLATFWVIVTVLLGAIMFCIVIEVGHLWVARAQLQTSLESASLSAVQDWSRVNANGALTMNPRRRGVALAAANQVGGVRVNLSTNFAGARNGNRSPNGHLVFGALRGAQTFDPNLRAGCLIGERPPIVRARITTRVPALCSGLLGVGSYNVTATSYAMYDCGSRRSRLVHIHD